MNFEIQKPLNMVVMLVMAFCLGCGDEAEPNLPTILGQNSSAECRDDNGVSKLDYIEVSVLDFDGAEDLGTAEVRVLSSILTMEKEAAVYQPSLDEAGNPVGPTCGVEGELCVARYVWRRRSDSEQIFCDLDEALRISFAVSDASGNEVSGVLLAEPVMD
jgi:hypothetical protein